MNHIVKSYDRDLEEVLGEVTAMGRLVREQLVKAADALEKLDADEARSVMTRDAEGNWHLLNMPAGLVTKVSKNQVTVTFDSTGPVLFIINTASMPVDKDGPKSPQTGEISPAWVIAGMTVVAACAAAYVVRRGKAA